MSRPVAADSSPTDSVAGAARDPRSNTLFRIGGIAALLVVAVLIAGLLSPVVSLPGLGLRSWLVVLFEINAGSGQLPPDVLRVFNPLDVAVLVLVGVAFVSLWPVLRRVSRILTVIAAGLPFIGIALLLITSQVGRSSVMGAGLVVAFLIFKSQWLGRAVVYLGMLANALLLVGDFATGSSAKPLIAVLLAVGYMLLAVWFGLVGLKLLRSDPALADHQRGG
ncbi:MAG TPA: hypothetical protein VN895_00375 [Candidatus Acidoferrum sp.]|nr:hypothetical protein [Candidatus Acidoferrum sp.]